MKKTINYTAALITVALFSGTAVANQQQAEDILHGNGAVTASSFSPYIQVDQGPRGTEGDLLSNLHEVAPSAVFIPYVRVESNQDNRDDLLNQVS